ncbi:MAG: galactose mutarotase [Oscillospiraceae bacterium]|nr:galactose mutarotase [Oscillospiraceae bacterium]
MVKSEKYGKLQSGEDILLYTLENKNGMKALVTNIGCNLQALFVPDKNGNIADVVLSPDMEKSSFGMGVIIGRNANRIKGAKVEVGGKTVLLDKNNGENNLHSNNRGMAVMAFEEAGIQDSNGSSSVKLRRVVADLSDGFPGNLDVTFTYTLTDDNAIILDYHAVCDQDTVINLTNHSYFNLAGYDSGNMHGQLLEIDADFYTPNGADSIPTGEIRFVEGTPFDFRKAKPIGQDIDADFEQVKMFGGYDHNIVLNGSGYRKIATASDPVSGRVMETWTDLPGVQLYTSNGMNMPSRGKGGASYGNHQGFCLETQTFPNAAQMPWVQSPIYKAGDAYISRTAYVFK